MVLPLATTAPLPGSCAVTVPPCAVDARLRPSSASAAFACSTDRPVTFGTVLSMCVFSVSEYDGSTPRYGRISAIILPTVGAAIWPPLM